MKINAEVNALPVELVDAVANTTFAQSVVLLYKQSIICTCVSVLMTFTYLDPRMRSDKYEMILLAYWHFSTLSIFPAYILAIF